MDKHVPSLRELSFNTSGKFWTGTEVTAVLTLSGLDKDNITSYEVIITSSIYDAPTEIRIIGEVSFCRHILKQ